MLLLEPLGLDDLWYPASKWLFQLTKRRVLVLFARLFPFYSEVRRPINYFFFVKGMFPHQQHRRSLPWGLSRAASSSFNRHTAAVCSSTFASICALLRSSFQQEEGTGEGGMWWGVFDAVYVFLRAGMPTRQWRVPLAISPSFYRR
jgi:hypothetical protein